MGDVTGFEGGTFYMQIEASVSYISEMDLNRLTQFYRDVELVSFTVGHDHTFSLG
jgi:hypothetical protein